MLDRRIVVALVIIAVICMIVYVTTRGASAVPAAPVIPCELGCSGSTPMCDESTNTCVACTNADTTHCPAGQPYCQNGQCASCVSSPVDTCGVDSPSAPHCINGACARCGADADCGPGMYCSEDGMSCVSCVAGDPGRSCGGGEYCVGDPAMCVECDPTHPCPAGHACLGGQCVQTCLSGAECGGSTPNCVNGLCVACATDRECASAFPGAAPYCANGLCVECLNGTNGVQTGCANPNAPLCVSTNCQQCYRDTDCKGNPRGPHCLMTETSEGSVYKCAACTSNLDCSAPTPNCRSSDHVCVECDASHPCAGGLACSKNGRCIECDANNPCKAGGICTDLTGGTCVQCRGDGDCAGRIGTYCSATGDCVSCRNNSDCGGSTPVCLPGGVGCAACAGDGDCADPAHPFCGDNHTCVRCDSKRPCPAGTFCDNGDCVECNAGHTCPNGGICAAGRCVGCVTDANCPSKDAPYCNGDSGTCGTCNTDHPCPCGNDCVGGKCSTTNSCYVWQEWDGDSAIPANAIGYNPLIMIVPVGARGVSGEWLLGGSFHPAYDRRQEYPRFVLSTDNGSWINYPTTGPLYVLARWGTSCPTNLITTVPYGRTPDSLMGRPMCIDGANVTPVPASGLCPYRRTDVVPAAANPLTYGNAIACMARLPNNIVETKNSDGSVTYPFSGIFTMARADGTCPPGTDGILPIAGCNTPGGKAGFRVRSDALRINHRNAPLLGPKGRVYARRPRERFIDGDNGVEHRMSNMILGSNNPRYNNGPEYSVLEDRLSGPDDVIDAAFGGKSSDMIWDQFRGSRLRSKETFIL